MYCILSNSLSPVQLGLQWGGMREVSGGNELLYVLTVGNYIHVLSHIQLRPRQGASAVLCAVRTAWGVGTERQTERGAGVSEFGGFGCGWEWSLEEPSGEGTHFGEDLLCLTVWTSMALGI